ncbi:hypothetical protein FEM48_ZijujUnG0106200 [Ziziphus jujuba var. spinosa]|uniref:Uncharacterized protein n=1 Tax=Ziziphus jujuba var. spinosa TaxID=714518 RepID=A0A978U854_ZIZJJ|nr:hypothetical protein FEM48_ZijujUnG0106200 [Ziziphus jujuba var. spinosa]
MSVAGFGMAEVYVMRKIQKEKLKQIEEEKATSSGDKSGTKQSGGGLFKAVSKIHPTTPRTREYLEMFVDFKFPKFPPISMAFSDPIISKKKIVSTFNRELPFLIFLAKKALSSHVTLGNSKCKIASADSVSKICQIRLSFQEVRDSSQSSKTHLQIVISISSLAVGDLFGKSRAKGPSINQWRTRLPP